jgi:hypothetical protein
MCGGRLTSIMGRAMNATDVTIRLARPEDARAVADLSVLDSAERPRGEVLVAEVDGSLWAALSLEDRHAVADPFHPSAELLPLLRERAHQLRRGMPHHRPVAGRRMLVRFSAHPFTSEP